MHMYICSTINMVYISIFDITLLFLETSECSVHSRSGFAICLSKALQYCELCLTKVLLRSKRWSGKTGYGTMFLDR